MIYVHHIVAAFVVLVGIGDWWTTRSILKQGGNEENPVMLFAMRLGKWWIIPKLLVHVIAAGLVIWVQHPYFTLPVALVSLVMVLVVHHNYTLIRHDEPT